MSATSVGRAASLSSVISGPAGRSSSGSSPVGMRGRVRPRPGGRCVGSPAAAVPMSNEGLKKKIGGKLYYV